MQQRWAAAAAADDLPAVLVLCIDRRVLSDNRAGGGILRSCGGWLR